MRMWNAKSNEANINMYEILKNYGIIPAIKIDDADKAVPLAESLALGGLNIAEVSFEPECAAETVKKISRAFPEMTVAAGTVLTVDQVKLAVDSGAKFIVSPKFNEEVVSYCRKHGIVIIPGCSNACDIDKALDMDISVVGFFHSEERGGIKTIKTLSASYPGVRFVPAGGIGGIGTDGNVLKLYLFEQTVLACGVSFMAKEEHIKYMENNEFEKITDLTLQTIYNMLGFDLSHIGVNCESAERADIYSSRIENIFGIKKSDCEMHISNGDILYFMKTKSYGRSGHIAISTDFIERAVFYLKSKGTDFIEESARFNENDELTSIYLDNSIGGFAVKLIQK